MTNPQKEKGSKAEREVAELLSQLLGLDCRRMLGAGRKDDVGDIHGIPDTVVQVANYSSIAKAITLKLPTVATQMDHARARFGALFIRRRGGRYIVVLEPEQWVDLLRAAAPDLFLPTQRTNVVQKGSAHA